MDPSTVRFPASVDDMASVSHAWSGRGSCETNGLKTRTAGTLLTRLETAALQNVSTPVWSSRSRSTKAGAPPANRVFSTPAMTTNSPANRTRSDQSISR